jgi:hypothetical protein
MVFQSQLQLQLNSNNADAKGDNTFTFYIPSDAILAESQEHIYLSVQSAILPYTFYNINENNNKLRYALTSNFIIETIVIPVGNYTIKDIVNYLNSEMTNFMVSYDKLYNKLTFTNLSTTDFKFFPTSTLYDVLGFTKGITFISNNGILYSVNGVNLNTVHYVNIKLNINTNNVAKYNINDRNIICSIPVNVSPYGVICYINDNNFRVNTFKNNISEVVVEFTDQNGYNINFNGVQWSLVLQLDIINFVI